MRILVVEDDAALRQGLRDQLVAAGYAVDEADNGIDAAHLGAVEPFDAAVLDLGLPRRPGLDVLKGWRQAGIALPVLILTARDAWHERVAGLQAGADDYLGKPFHPAELLARLQALLRRSQGRADPLLRVGTLTLDEERQTVALDDQTIDLTGAEFRLLRYMMSHAGRILSKTQLTEHLYDGDHDPDSNVLEVLINRLRQKIGRDRIETRRGQGYVLRS